jgi:cell division protein FtsI/penicillin-binding protein 2
MIDRRIGLLFVIFIALLGIGLTRAAYLGAVRSGSLQRAATTQQVTKVTIPAPRGTITDRNGRDLAISEAAADIAADPYLIKDPEGVARQFAPLLGKPEEKVLASLSPASSTWPTSCRATERTRSSRSPAGFASAESPFSHRSRVPTRGRGLRLKSSAPSVGTTKG